MAGLSKRGVDRQYRRTTYVNDIDSVDGNTARQLNAVPERRERNVPARKHRRQPERQPVHMAGIDGVSFIFMVCALCIVICFAFSYIHTQNEVRGMKKEVISMQAEVKELQEDNDIAYNKVLASVDLADIYRIATGKLHMVMADGNKVYKYKNKKSDMVKQYSDIPQSGN